jgi:hypothetical protein
VDTHLARLDDVDPFFVVRLVEDVVGIEEDVDELVGDGLLEAVAPPANKEDGRFHDRHHVLLHHVYILIAIPILIYSLTFSMIAFSSSGESWLISGLLFMRYDLTLYVRLGLIL